MPDNVKHKILTLRQQWHQQSGLTRLLYAIAIGSALASIASILLPFNVWLMAAFLIVIIAIIALIKEKWQVSNASVTNYLNQHYTTLEDSSELLLKDSDTLNILEQLQVQKISRQIETLDVKSPYSKALYRIGGMALVALVVTFGMSKISKPSSRSIDAISLQSSVKKDVILPAINKFTVNIQPPSYTNLPNRKQASFNMQLPVGSKALWQITTNIKVASITITFNDSLKVMMQPSDESHTAWQMVRTITQSGFYQLNIDGKLSDLYQIETIKDALPIISVASPKPNTIIDFGQPTKVPLNLTITDDYGIIDAFVNATIASGSGEGVKFKEQKIALATSFKTGQLQYNIGQIIDLKKLAMQPGDELYFYVKAIDNNLQESRSDIFIITLPDTTQLINLEGVANNVNFKPELFRSERQIIIDAEQLLKDKDTISLESFKNRSNNLGVDQKLLRLRYGKFLGEENESNQGIEDAESLDAKDFGDGKAMMDAVTDKHDNAEDASFLDADTKKRLKAVLNEMWNAELQLRTFKPQEALPFAYKALRLLKDLQQSSRVYVAKTSLKTTPLKPEKRLTADLTKVVSPTTQQQVVIAANNNTILQAALSVLETMKAHECIASGSVLAQALPIISNKASTQPTAYLPALTALKQLLLQQQQATKTINKADIIVVQKAIQKILAAPITTPQQQNAMPSKALSTEYFNQLYKHK
ncbi:hypothetical protein ACFOW1_06655 [Parasediminibacterium paludis]|uniref:DUF4175 family protein n=1 Tax=Parasediminibacterium paludis TaxID=908966 RepID=A0ABV8PW36_9BACT